MTSRVPNTQSISLVAEKNPFPLAATFDVANGAEPYASVRIKMGQNFVEFCLFLRGGGGNPLSGLARGPAGIDQGAHGAQPIDGGGAIPAMCDHLRQKGIVIRWHACTGHFARLARSFCLTSQSSGEKLLRHRSL